MVNQHFFVVFASALAAASLAGCANESGASLFEAAPVGLVEQTAVFVNECEAGGSGGSVGDRISNMQLQNCYGETIALHDYCGRRRAVWLIGSAGWCGACTAYLPQAAAEFLATRHEGVELFVVLSEDAGYNPPTEEYCFEYAADKGIDPSRLLMDNGLQATWSTLDPGGSSIGLPWEAVLDPYDMTYVWANSVDGGVAASVLSEMVAN